jgi:hypothetical protein
VLLTCWGIYQHVSQPSSPSSPAALPEAAAQAERRPLDQTPEPPVAVKDENRLRQADAAPPALAPEPSRDTQKEPAQKEPAQREPVQEEARLDDATGARTIEPTEQAERRPLEQESELPVADKDESRLQQTVAAPAVSEPDGLTRAQKEIAPKQDAQKEARLEDAGSAGTSEGAEPGDTKGKLSYLAWYAYSELPPETKPADTVLNFLKDVPPGTPVEEIRRVADVLGFDFSFLKAIAKIESGFDPKQRTGSYIGLFQLSRHEFRKYGSGDILDARDNAVAAALKMKTEAVLFQMFTRRKATLFDLYLIHQQGIEGAAEHISQPNRLAWRSMCKTEEGKEKGERWCKRAIWGNTLPALKRSWKSVNKVTSGAFVAMWQERVSHFYGRYSQAAAN